MWCWCGWATTPHRIEYSSRERLNNCVPSEWPKICAIDGHHHTHTTHRRADSRILPVYLVDGRWSSRLAIPLRQFQSIGRESRTNFQSINIDCFDTRICAAETICADIDLVGYGYTAKMTSVPHLKVSIIRPFCVGWDCAQMICPNQKRNLPSAMGKYDGGALVYRWNYRRRNKLKLWMPLVAMYIKNV